MVERTISRRDRFWRGGAGRVVERTIPTCASPRPRPFPEFSRRTTEGSGVKAQKLHPRNAASWGPRTSDARQPPPIPLFPSTPWLSERSQPPLRGLPRHANSSRSSAHTGPHKNLPAPAWPKAGWDPL